MGIFGSERVGDRRVAPASGRGRGVELLEPLPYRRFSHWPPSSQ